MRGKFSFLYVDIWFNVTKCKFIVKNSSFEMLVVFSPIFVADTKMTFVYNFVAPLISKSSDDKNTVFIKVMYENDIFKVSTNEFWIVNRINYVNFNCRKDKRYLLLSKVYTDVITNKIYHYIDLLLSFLFIPKHMPWKAKSMNQIF